MAKITGHFLLCAVQAVHSLKSRSSVLSSSVSIFSYSQTLTKYCLNYGVPIGFGHYISSLEILVVHFKNNQQ